MRFLEHRAFGYVDSIGLNTEEVLRLSRRIVATRKGTKKHKVGVLLNWHAGWIGWHYSEHHKRLCINLIPCVTLWWTKPGGTLP